METTEPSKLKAFLGIAILLGICAWIVYRKARWQKEADEVWRIENQKIRDNQRRRE